MEPIGNQIFLAQELETQKEQIDAIWAIYAGATKAWRDMRQAGQKDATYAKCVREWVQVAKVWQDTRPSYGPLRNPQWGMLGGLMRWRINRAVATAQAAERNGYDPGARRTPLR